MIRAHPRVSQKMPLPTLSCKHVPATVEVFYNMYASYALSCMCTWGMLLLRCVPISHQVLTEPIALDKEFEDALNDRLVLVFTGKQRLARSEGSSFFFLSVDFSVLRFRRCRLFCLAGLMGFVVAGVFLFPDCYCLEILCRCLLKIPARYTGNTVVCSFIPTMCHLALSPSPSVPGHHAVLMQ